MGPKADYTPSASDKENNILWWHNAALRARTTLPSTAQYSFYVFLQVL